MNKKLTDKEKLKIAIEALEYITGINNQPFTVQPKLTEKGIISEAKDALEQIQDNPNPKTMTMKEAILKDLKFSYNTDDYTYNAFQNVMKIMRIDSMDYNVMPAAWILAHQDEQVTIIEED